MKNDRSLLLSPDEFNSLREVSNAKPRARFHNCIGSALLAWAMRCDGSVNSV
jgi:hypothetical protein